MLGDALSFQRAFDRRSEAVTFTDKFLAHMYPVGRWDEMTWLLDRPGMFERLEQRIDVNGARWDYTTELDAGGLDWGSEWNHDDGGAEAYDDGTW